MTLANSLHTLGRYGRDLARGVYARTTACGPRSGWVFARASLRNLYLAQRNKRGGRRAQCPCCGWQGHDFLSLDVTRFEVPRVYCPRCRCQERHRMLRLYFDRVDPRLREGSGLVLHFAPEPYLRTLIEANPRLCPLYTDYDPNAIRDVEGNRFAADMHCLPLPDNCVDFIFCLHVLEHVQDDRRGIQNLARVLRPGGVAYLMVPFIVGLDATEDWAKPDPFWFDHYRSYSVNDFKSRLSPFEYEEVWPQDFLTPDETFRYGIPTNSQVLYRCTCRA